MSAPPRLRDSGNALLDRLPCDEFDALGPMLQRVRLNLKEVINQEGSEVAYVHFPTTALVSLMAVLEEDDPVETATVGHEGFIGLAAALGVGPCPERVMCQLPGESLRMPIRPFLDAMARGPALRGIVHRYIVYSLRVTGQAIACNSLHTVESRASRWLLTIHDQVGRDEFPMTQEFLAFMLGVRRQTVTFVAGTLQVAGLIQYRRGYIAIRDRAGLEQAACECYATIRAYYHRVLS